MVCRLVFCVVCGICTVAGVLAWFLPRRIVTTALQAVPLVVSSDRQTASPLAGAAAWNRTQLRGERSHTAAMRHRSPLGRALEHAGTRRGKRGNRRWRPPDAGADAAGEPGDRCRGRGVFDPRLDECRCVAGWRGRYCHVRAARPCNHAKDGGILMRESVGAATFKQPRDRIECSAEAARHSTAPRTQGCTELHLVVVAAKF